MTGLFLTAAVLLRSDLKSARMTLRKAILQSRRNRRRRPKKTERLGDAVVVL